MQSRYYNPAIGRFLNADAYASTGQGIIGNNMFAYCNNSPVAFYDNAGTRAECVSNDFGAPAGFASAGVLSYNTRSGNKATGNTDEQTVLAARFAAYYKGNLVIKIPGSSAFSFGVIFLGNDGGKDLLNHEYGHTVQLETLGMIDYCTYVVIPSIICFWGTELGILSDENYYSYPWEYQADQYRGVKRPYKDWAKDNAARYWNQVP